MNHTAALSNGQLASADVTRYLRAMDPESTLTVKEVAEIFRVHIHTVIRWLRDGRLIGRKEGNRWRVRQGDVDDADSLGLGKKYWHHAPGHIRGALGDAFDTDDEWWMSFDTPKQALMLLGKLWNCTDIVPGLLRVEIAEWLDDERLLHGCTYAQAARALKEELLRVLDEDKVS